MSGRRLACIIAPDQAGKTVDTLLRRVLQLSGTALKRAKKFPDGILLNHLPVSVTQTVTAGQRLSVLVGDAPEEHKILPVSGPLDIVFEDDDLMVVNKPAGIPVHPGPGHFDDTLGNFIAFYYEKQGLTALYRPVNRLDRGTSGLMVVAKHAHAQTQLIAQLHTGAFQRIYLALCDGILEPPSGFIDAPIGRADNSALRREVRADGAAARTRYEVLGHCEGRSLVRLELDTGRTHQIRVHMAHLGCAVTGDFLYGVENQALISRTALHSAELRLKHPLTGKELHWSAPLPADMQKLRGDPSGAPEEGA